MAKRKDAIDGWYTYTATGVLEKTEPNRTPTQFVVNGVVNEKWSTHGKVETRKGKSCLIPEKIEKSSNFLDKIPLGTKIIFTESAHRSGKRYKHSFSIKVVEGKKAKGKTGLTRKQKSCSHSNEKRVEEIGQGCGFGLVCRDCDLLLETSPTNIYG
ncbi:MAG TPA: hypothetical protein VJH71_03435 [Candidatus Paceibacterota bacterium]